MSLQQTALGEWHLCVQNADLTAIGDVSIDAFPFRIGRRSGLELTLPSQQVSGNHAMVDVKDGELVICDLGSTNGTFVNGNQVDRSMPLESGDLLQVADIVFRVQRHRPSSVMSTLCEQNLTDAIACVEFEQLIKGQGVNPFFQPIVDLQNQTVLGYEGLGRSTLSVLSNPAAMFSTAAKLKQEAELSRMLRVKILESAYGLPDEILIFLNSHPTELHEPQRFLHSLDELRQTFPHRRLALEIHEGSIADIDWMKKISDALHEWQILLAYDDFGAGQSRFVELIEVPPRYLKFDISLIRGINDASPQRRRAVRALTKMAHDLDVVALAEGVETAAEAECCHKLGFQLAQGYYFGRPAPLDAGEPIPPGLTQPTDTH